MLRSILLLLSICLLLSCKTTTYIVVRHAEKETGVTTNDPSLSAAGKQRAEALKERLNKTSIDHIYSTSYQRAKNTAQPVADAKHLTVEIYDPRDKAFAENLLKMKGGTILIVGHSNTVDDMVNRLAGEIKVPGDLPDSAYGDLFTIRKRARFLSFKKGQYDYVRFRSEHFGN
jgi:broad specificity phosphatase PhoE